MDLLSRRTSTATRRGTLLPGGARRNGTSGLSSATAVPAAVSAAKTALLDEFRAHEEDVATRVIQRAARAYLSRQYVAALVRQIYRRQYDPIERKYYYINTATNETTWEKPRVLRLFLSDAHDVPVAKASVVLSEPEAARRIQRCARALLAKRFVHRLVCELYMKLFDPESKTYYYLDTRTGERSTEKPLFLRHATGTNKVDDSDAHDIPVETFQFRRAVCKVSSSSNLYGSGVLGVFGGGTTGTRLCLLSDATTLPDAATASTAHVMCNYGGADAVPFPVPLCPEALFVPLALVPQAPPAFALCAVDRDAFLERAGSNVVPLRFEVNDRKMGCADATSGSVKLRDVVEVVGHPHGKPRVVHTRTLAKLLPHSIAPVAFELDRATESGSAGCAVFTRGGKLLGLQRFVPLKESPRDVVYIRTILDAAHALVTPPQPFLLTTSLLSHDVHVCWSVVRWFQPLAGLAIEFELELCRPSALQPTTTTTTKRRTLDTFTCVYRGPHKSKHVGGLDSDRLVSLRVRVFNALATSAWSHVLTVRTLPTPSLAWRIPRFCASVRDACARMRQQPVDAAVQLEGVRWLLRSLDQHATDAEAMQRAEGDFLDARGLDWMLETVTTRFPAHRPLVATTIRVLTTLTRRRQRTQRLLSQVVYMTIVQKLLERHLCRVEVPRPDVTDIKVDVPSESTTDEIDAMEIARACVELLGAVLDGETGGNASAQQTAQTLALVPMLLDALADDDNARLHDHAPFVADCAFLFARYTHHHTLVGKWQFVAHGRLVVLRDILDAYAANGGATTVVYWTLVTLGNVCYASEQDAAARAQLDSEAHALQLVAAVCDARTQFLLRVHELERALGAAQREFARLAASVMGDDMRNELDACEHEIATLLRAREELHHLGDVAQAGDFALRYVLTDAQRRVRAASQRVAQRLLQRAIAAAFAKWCDVTCYEQRRSVVGSFLTAVRLRQLSGAFRKWEVYLRADRQRHKSVLVDAVLGAGLAIDMNKRKREKYRLLALQK